jgi:hypothetical protein
LNRVCAARFREAAQRWGALRSATTAAVERSRELRHAARNTRNTITLARALRALLRRRTQGR